LLLADVGSECFSKELAIRPNAAKLLSHVGISQRCNAMSVKLEGGLSWPTRGD
jgi:hypothetical protein